MSDKVTFESAERPEGKVSASNAVVSNEEMSQFAQIKEQSKTGADCTAKYLPDMDSFFIKCVVPLDEAQVNRLPEKPKPTKPGVSERPDYPIKTPEQNVDENSNNVKVPRDGGLKNDVEGSANTRGHMTGQAILRESALARPYGPQ